MYNDSFVVGIYFTYFELEYIKIGLIYKLRKFIKYNSKIHNKVFGISYKMN